MQRWDGHRDEDVSTPSSLETGGTPDQTAMRGSTWVGWEAEGVRERCEQVASVGRNGHGRGSRLRVGQWVQGCWGLTPAQLGRDTVV